MKNEEELRSLIKTMVEESSFGGRRGIKPISSTPILSDDEEQALEVMMESGRRSGGFDRTDTKMLKGDLYEYATYLRDLIGEDEFRENLQDEIDTW